MATYSFKDVLAAISGNGVTVSMGNGAGAAEEGITIEPTEEIDTMTIGADGSPMHSLHADQSGKITVRLLKTSPVNALLMGMYNFQTSSGLFHGQSVLNVTNIATQDSISCTSVAFARAPRVLYAKDGGVMEWEFNAGRIIRTLGFNV